MSIVGQRLDPLIELEGLLTDCIREEERLNELIRDKLEKEFPDLQPTTQLTKHGAYIKFLLRDSSLYTNHKWGKYPQTEIGTRVMDWFVSDKNPLQHTHQDLINMGIASVYVDLLKNLSQAKEYKTSDEYYRYFLGNLDEMKSFYNLKTMLEKKFPNSGATITDTAPKQFKDSVRYDIKITFPDTVRQLEDATEFISGFSVNLENKLGITNSAKTSSFHFGTVSSDAIGGGSLTYTTFLNAIRQISIDYLTGATFGDEVKEIAKAKSEFMRKLAIQFIRWKLQNNWPVFVSSGAGNIVLCSEVLKIMINNKIMKFDKGTEDPGDTIVKYFLKRTYKETNTIYDEESGEYQNVTSKGFNFWSSGGMFGDEQQMQLFKRKDGKVSIDSIRDVDREMAKAAVDKVLNWSSTAGISPRFKMSLWYGK